MLDLIAGGWIAPFLCVPLPAETNKKLNKYKNKTTFQNVFVHNMLTALDRYYIDGLPDTCSQRVVLQALLWYGKVLFFEKVGNIYALPCVNSTDGFTVYGEWRSAFWVGLNGQSENVNLVIPGGTAFLKKIIAGGKNYVSEGNGVLVRENSLMYPFIWNVWQYSEYMADTLRTLDVARVHLKHPYIITAEQSVVPSVKKWLNDTKENQDAIVSSGIFPSDKVTIQDLNVSGDVVNSVTALYEWYEAQFLGLCGIAHNSGIDKKGENLITPEIGIDEENDNTNLNMSMDYIQQGLDTANDRFGLNMTVNSVHLSEKEEMEDDYTGYDDISGSIGKQSEPDNG